MGWERLEMTAVDSSAVVHVYYDSDCTMISGIRVHDTSQSSCFSSEDAGAGYWRSSGSFSWTCHGTDVLDQLRHADSDCASRASVVRRDSTPCTSQGNKYERLLYCGSPPATSSTSRQETSSTSTTLVSTS